LREDTIIIIGTNVVDKSKKREENNTLNSLGVERFLFFLGSLILLVGKSSLVPDLNRFRFREEEE